LLTNLAFDPHQVGGFHAQRCLEGLLAVKSQQEVNVATPQGIFDPAAEQLQLPRPREERLRAAHQTPYVTVTQAHG
jgi:hypothetical protein